MPSELQKQNQERLRKWRNTQIRELVQAAIWMDLTFGVNPKDYKAACRRVKRLGYRLRRPELFKREWEETNDGN